MRILIIGAGVLGCNMAHNFYVAGKDVTLFARGTWGQNIKERGLVIKNKFSLRSTCDKISVIDDKDFIYKIIDANAECYEAIESLGHELLPKGEENYRLEKYRKRTYRFYKLLFSTVLGKICISDHAMNAADEMNVLAGELEKMTVSAGVKADNFNELKKYINKYLG